MYGSFLELIRKTLEAEGKLWMADVNFQQLSTVQSSVPPFLSSPIIPSAATIAPTTFLTEVTGTVQVATVTPFVTGDHMIALNFTNASPGAFLTSGNLITAYQPIQNRPILMFYVARLAKWYQAAVV